MLEKLLVLKFGDQCSAYAARIEASSDAQLDRYIEQILTAETLEAVFVDG